MPEADLPALVALLVERLTLSEGATKLYGTLSGGNKRKCAVALALIGNPSVVILGAGARPGNIANSRV